MKLAIKAYAVTLVLLMLVFAVPTIAQYSDKEDRNTAPTVGTGGAVGGPTGLFTVYDGHTLRKGEYTFSLALSNFDRDPGNADITDVPASFQVGLSNRFEVFFNTNLYRGIKVNSPRNLSSFYLPNTGGSGLPAIVLAPEGPGANPYLGVAVFRPSGMPFAAYPFTGGNAGRYQLLPATPVFGFGANVPVTLGPPRANSGSGNASMFPGVGSVFGSILPGVVLTTTTINNSQRPVTFAVAPSYLPDAPFVSRTWGTSSFDSFDVGVKWRINDSMKAIGYGLVGYYTWYVDKGGSFAGFNQMQRGAGPGASGGDLGGSFFVDARIAKWANLSTNIGYKFVTNPKMGSAVLLDRPDEFTWAVGADFPVNRFFQPILEFRSLAYVRSRTPNAAENNPMDGLAGVRIFPRRWFGLSLAYRINFNQQDADSLSDSTSTASVLIPCPTGVAGCLPISTSVTSTGAPQGFVTSTDPHGYILQLFFGRRDARKGEVPNIPAVVNSVTLGDSVVTLPCRPGFRSTSGACNDSKSVSVATSASDAENDVLTYNYTVSGGRIVGTGANVTWDLSNAQPGTYTITTGVDDGCGVCGKTNTQTITIAECSDCVQICPECPSLTVSGPSGVTSPGTPMTFTANIAAGAGITYNWSVSAGTISSGQGTASISVDTTGLAGQSVTATVNIGGFDAACPCPSTASETAPVLAKPTPNMVDEFGALKDDDVKARVDNFYIALNNDPNARGYIINYGTPAQIKARRAQIMKAINFRKYDVNRVTFVDGPDNGTGVNTRFYTVPAGADNPTP